MLRVIFDTNIYGHLLNEPDGGEIEDKIVAETNFIDTLLLPKCSK
ncbi:MAG TPA: hypothetical protein VJH68_03770 [Candidatus Nanoarchaeia archaeon]|nr:hypothetical protein [Candidatus Nanoarchaeia archaeon]